MDDLITTIVQALAYLAGATGLALVVLRFSASGRALVQRTIGGQELWFGFAAALLMTLASLYLSEVRHFLPCLHPARTLRQAADPSPVGIRAPGIPHSL